MEFVTVPKNYAPVNEGLVYNIDLEVLRDNVEVSIVDAAKDENIAVLRFAQTSFISVDIAPYVRRMFEPYPAEGPFGDTFGVDNDRGRVVEVAVEVDGERSPLRRYTMLLTDGLPRLLTLMPGRRQLAENEADEVAFYAPSGGSIIIETETPSKLERMEVELPASEDIGVLRIAANDLPDEYLSVDVTFEAGGRTDSISYDRAVRPQGAVRLAWTASSGAVEHYTFPSHSSTLTITRDAFCSRAGHRTTHRRSEAVQLLVSDYEPQSVIEALEEILSAARVWRIDNGIVTEVEVVTASTLRRFDGPLNTLSVEIRNIRREEDRLC